MARSGGDDNVIPLRRSRPGAWLREWPITLVLAGVALAMILIALDSFRRGSVVLSASVLLAAFLRLLLPDDDAGMLAVRTKKVDVITLGLLGIGVTVFTFWVPPPS
jgi:Protein of unknown function (DUF3017)